METLEEVLRSVVEGTDYKAAHAEQRRAILSFLQGKDVFVFLPRGSGKNTDMFLVVTCTVNNQKGGK